MRCKGSGFIQEALFEAVADLDAGPIHLQQQIKLQGHELVEEWRSLQAQATLELCLAWFDRYQEVVSAAQPQQGEASHYRRRRPADSQLDRERSLAEQFELLRVVDNRCYPAFFQWRGRRYVLQVWNCADDRSLPRITLDQWTSQPFPRSTRS